MSGYQAALGLAAGSPPPPLPRLAHTGRPRRTVHPAPAPFLCHPRAAVPWPGAVLMGVKDYPVTGGSKPDIRMLVASSCTGRKSVSHDRVLALEDFRDPDRLRAREAELAGYRVPASRLYTGLQHVLMMNGVNTIRQHFAGESVTVRIVSAGYGLVPEDRLLAPYEVTFKDMGRRELLAWSRRLNIARDVTGRRRTSSRWPSSCWGRATWMRSSLP